MNAILGFGEWLLFSKSGRALIGVLALAGAIWWAYSTTWQRGYDQGHAEATAAYEAALSAARQAQAAAEAERDRIGAEIADAAQAQAQAASEEVQTQASTAVERIRTVIRTVEVPAECPQRLPEPVQGELRDAINRANEAGRLNRKQRRALRCNFRFSPSRVELPHSGKPLGGYAGKTLGSIAPTRHPAPPLTQQENEMHYRNGREAKNGDKLVQIDSNGQVVAVGVLHSATPGNDYCNGYIAPTQHPVTTACMVDCLHLDDLAALLAEKGLAARPEGK